MKTVKVAIVEDDLLAANMLEWYLHSAKYETHVFDSIQDLKENFDSKAFDVMLLDWQLPDGSAPEVIDYVRQDLASKMPIMIESAHSEEDKVVDALRRGADDYVYKPIRAEEFIARLDALMRRSQAHNKMLTVGAYEFDEYHGRVSAHGEPVDLSRYEAKLFGYFVRNLNRQISREEIFEEVWGKEEVSSSRTVDVHVNKIRRKLKLDEHSKVQIVSVHGFGYSCIYNG